MWCLQGWANQRNDGVAGDLRARCADGRNDLALVGICLFNSLIKQLADETDRVQCDGDDACQNRRPGPTMVTNSSAQISELIDREATLMHSARGCSSQRIGDVLRAARNVIGTAISIPRPVLSVVIFSVSHSGCRILAVYTTSAAATCATPCPSLRLVHPLRLPRWCCR